MLTNKREILKEEARTCRALHRGTAKRLSQETRQPDEIEPEVLLTFLRLLVICEILDLHTTASMYPAISTTRLMGIPIAVPKQSIRDKVVAKVRAALTARAEAARLPEAAEAEIERLVLKTSSD